MASQSFYSLDEADLVGKTLIESGAYSPPKRKQREVSGNSVKTKAASNLVKSGF